MSIAAKILKVLRIISYVPVVFVAVSKLHNMVNLSARLKDALGPAMFA